MAKIKVRIPEIHPFPEPDVYGPEGSPGIINLYPTFIAISSDIPSPDVGELVYVDYGDRVNFEDPRYYGKVYQKSIYGGANVIGKKNIVGELSTLFNTVPGFLSDTLSFPRSDDYTPVPIQINKLDDLEMFCRGNVCFETINAGERDVFLKGKKVGKMNVVSWTNRDGTKSFIREDIEQSVKKMALDLLKETGLVLRINEGVRDYHRQKLLYEKYRNDLAEWEENGSPPKSKPSPAGNPDLGGEDTHLFGRAIDFGSDTAPFNKNKTKIWKWLSENSENYGWIWTGKNFSPQEPWHYFFSEDLARSIGILNK